MLSFENLQGIFACIPLPWEKSNSIDEDLFAETISKLADYGVNGIYNGGSTGEFFAQDFNIFKRTTDILTTIAKKKGFYTQVGISGLTTEQVIKKGLYAIENGIDGI